MKMEPTSRTVSVDLRLLANNLRKEKRLKIILALLPEESVLFKKMGASETFLANQRALQDDIKDELARVQVDNYVSFASLDQCERARDYDYDRAADDNALIAKAKEEKETA